jgi:lambda family phage portal protein
MRRVKARASYELLSRHYEAATVGRRTQGWKTSTGDANAAVSQGLTRLRENARDLIRNNPYAESAVQTIADHAVGWGITAKPKRGQPRTSSDRFVVSWKLWAESTSCDSEGRLDFYGLQKMAMRSIVESGEVLIRRRWRRPEDNLPLPLQLQVLEADYLDHTRDGVSTATGGVIVQGVEYDVLGRRSAYWLYRDHPGSTARGLRSGIGQSYAVPASEILHIFKPGRPSQVRGVSWFAPVLVRLKDFDEYEDAALMKQKIAACLAVLTTDVDGTTPPLGNTDPQQPALDFLEPGMISNLPPGRGVTVVDPPAVSEHAPYAQTVLRAIAAGLGVTYEDLCGDYTNLPFSAARMSRLRHWARVEDWRWRMLIPQFCDPVWAWAVEAARVMGILNAPLIAEWTTSPMPMIEPDREGLAYLRNIRTGIQTLPDAIRERGYDPDELLAEYKASNELLDKLGLILDSDPRHTTQQGGPRDSTPPTAPTPAPAEAPVSGSNGNGRYHRDDIDRAWRILEETIHRALEIRRMETTSPPPVNVTTGSTNVLIDKGAVQANISTPPVNVEAPVTIQEGAVQVDVQAPTQFAEGAIQTHINPPDVTVEAPVTIQEGAIQVEVEAPTTIQEGAIAVTPPQPQITVVRARSIAPPARDENEEKEPETGS